MGEAKKTQKKKTNVRTESDYYLDDDPSPDRPGFNALHFWKLDPKYPTLKKIARDALAIPASTTASKSDFSMGCRVLNPHRSSLHFVTMEALMHLQNWIVGNYLGNNQIAFGVFQLYCLF